ncbi:MAG: hypothetical protein K9I69_04475 [Ignavibacteriales bacterium]|nr:hypothetical protein [Ignavibacteriales bacterium]MCF8316974.1 hypothetical protein [Ignavibacteriales bacterium]MCF8438558.1 hypothetical protein [Ignavibacteriales bacterium]
MIDLNPFGMTEMSRHREAELYALIAAYKSGIFDKNNIELINYEYLIKNTGPENMRSPVGSGY